jgi:hypothetical protein
VTGTLIVPKPKARGKKAYTPPLLTEYGPLAEKTKAVHGEGHKDGGGPARHGTA